MLCLVLSVSSCAAHHSGPNVRDQAERLAEEKGRLTELTDPFERTKSYITVSGILLDFAASFARDGNTEGTDVLLSQYAAAVQQATDTLLNSDRNAQQAAEGFQDLESTLNSQIPLLKKLSKKLGSKHREPAETALQIATSARERLSARLFPKP